MKAVITILLALCFSFVNGQSLTLEGAREAFHQAVMDEEESRAFNKYMRTFDEPTPVIAAYQAVSEAMLARVLWNPFSKLAQVRDYQKAMEAAVALDPNDIEIRFLRLAIEYNIPAFLGMSEHVEEDVAMILENLSSAASLRLDPAYGQYIFYFLEQTDLCSDDQILAMRASLDEVRTY